VPVVWNPPPVRSFQELLDTKKSIKMGSTGVSTPNSIYQHLMNSVLGTHFEPIEGYTGQGEVFLAMERGELQGSGAPFYSSLNALKPDWLRDKKVTILVQIALEKHPALPDVPLITEFAKTKEALKSIELATAALSMGRPYALPEGVPPDRIKILRDAFQATLKDPEFLQDAEKTGLEVSPIDGDAVHNLLVKMYNTPQPIIDRVTSIFVRR
jgi:tripartite-type tricarboxylate transporter receptor subunit TctC